MAVLLGTLAAAAWLVGCASTQGARGPERPAPETAHRGPPPRDPAGVTVGELAWDPAEGAGGVAFVDGRTGEALTWAQVTSRLAAVDVAVVGEQHDQLPHHRLQARVIQALGQASAGKVSVALEMVPWSLQGPLDRYRAGEIDEDGLRAAVDWETTWGHDFELYRDIFRTGREVRARFVGVNAPRDLVRSVAREGVDGVTAEQREVLPELDLNDEEHKRQIQAVFEQHHPPAAGGALDRFYAAQVLWDESMADGSAKALDEADKVVVLAGVGHVAGYRGIPNRLLRRRPEARLLTIVPITLDDGEDPQAVARAAVASGEGDILALIRPREVLSI